MRMLAMPLRMPVVILLAAAVLPSFASLVCLPLRLVLLKYFALGVIPDDLDVDEGAQVELLGTELRHDEVQTRCVSRSWLLGCLCGRGLFL